MGGGGRMERLLVSGAFVAVAILGNALLLRTAHAGYAVEKSMHMKGGVNQMWQDDGSLLVHLVNQTQLSQHDVDILLGGVDITLLEATEVDEETPSGGSPSDPQSSPSEPCGETTPSEFLTAAGSDYGGAEPMITSDAVDPTTRTSDKDNITAADSTSVDVSFPLTADGETALAGGEVATSTPSAVDTTTLTTEEGTTLEAHSPSSDFVSTSISSTADTTTQTSEESTTTAVYSSSVAASTSSAVDTTTLIAEEGTTYDAHSTSADFLSTSITSTIDPTTLSSEEGTTTGVHSSSEDASTPSAVDTTTLTTEEGTTYKAHSTSADFVSTSIPSTADTTTQTSEESTTTVVYSSSDGASTSSAAHTTTLTTEEGTTHEAHSTSADVVSTSIPSTADPTTVNSEEGTTTGVHSSSDDSSTPSAVDTTTLTTEEGTTHEAHSTSADFVSTSIPSTIDPTMDTSEEGATTGIHSLSVTASTSSAADTITLTTEEGTTHEVHSTSYFVSTSIASISDPTTVTSEEGTTTGVHSSSDGASTSSAVDTTTWTAEEGTTYEQQTGITSAASTIKIEPTSEQTSLERSVGTSSIEETTLGTTIGNNWSFGSSSTEQRTEANFSDSPHTETSDGVETTVTATAKEASSSSDVSEETLSNTQSYTPDGEESTVSFESSSADEEPTSPAVFSSEDVTQGEFSSSQVTDELPHFSKTTATAATDLAGESTEPSSQISIALGTSITAPSSTGQSDATDPLSQSSNTEVTTGALSSSESLVTHIWTVSADVTPITDVSGGSSESSESPSQTSNSDQSSLTSSTATSNSGTDFTDGEVPSENYHTEEPTEDTRTSSTDETPVSAGSTNDTSNTYDSSSSVVSTDVTPDYSLLGDHSFSDGSSETWTTESVLTENRTSTSSADASSSLTSEGATDDNAATFTTIDRTTTSPIIQETTAAIRKCPQIQMDIGGTIFTFSETAAGGTAAIPCTIGVITYNCGADGEWLGFPDFSDCQNLDFSSFDDILDNPDVSVSNLTNTVLEGLNNQLANYESAALTQDGVDEVLSILDRVNTAFQNSKNPPSPQEAHEFLAEFTSTTSTILKAKEAWVGSNSAWKVNAFAKVLDGPFSAGLESAQYLDSSTETVVSGGSDLSFALVKDVTSQASFDFNGATMSFSVPTFALKSESKASQAVNVVFIGFENLHEVVNDTSFLSDEAFEPSFDGATWQINSKILGSRFDGLPKKLYHGSRRSKRYVQTSRFSRRFEVHPSLMVASPMPTAKVAHQNLCTRRTGDKVVCAMWRADGHWASCIPPTGGLLQQETTETTDCYCQFDVSTKQLVQAAFIRRDVRLACVIENIRDHRHIVIPGLSTGALAFFVVLVAITATAQGATVDRFSFIRWNFAACGVTAKVLLVVVYDVEALVDNDSGCKAMNAVVHVLAVAGVCWLTAEAVFIKAVVSRVVRPGDPVKTKWSKRRILATCYGSAAVVVAIVLIASLTDGYTSSTYCFINVKNGMIWTLAGPLIFLAAVNGICLLLTSVSTCSFASIEEDETSSQPELMETADRSAGAFGEFRESRLRVARYCFENFLLSALSLGQWASAIVFYLERTKTMAILFGIFSAADGVAALIFYVLLTDYLFGKQTKDPPGTLHHFAGNAWRMEAINQEVVAGGRHQRKNEGQSQYVNEAFNDTDGDDADPRRRHRAATATPPPTSQPPPPPSSQLAKIIAGDQQRRNRQGSDGFDATRQRVMIEMTERRSPQSRQQRTRFDMAASTPGDVRGAANQQERPLRTATVMRIPRVRQLRY